MAIRHHSLSPPCSHLPKGFINRQGKSHLPLYSSIYSPSSAHDSKKTLLRRHCSPAGAAASSAPLRRTGNFQPSIWDDSYLQSLPINYLEDEHEKKREKLKKEVRLLLQKQKGVVEQLELVDALRQLGVAYHFEQEIKDVLNSISSPLALGIKSIENILIDSNNIHGTALLFRLLREYGFDASHLISVDALLRSFKVQHEHDVEGLLSIYEASFLSIEGEDELEEGGESAAKQLSNLRRKNSSLDPKIIELIDHSLELPLHWRMPRLHTRWFIDFYENQENVHSNLLELAKLDFNMVQSMHKMELKRMSRWWTELGLVCDELGFARNRLVEHYLWTVGYTFEPQFGSSREAITKTNCLITTIDDIYDVFGTLNELELFTKAIREWRIIAELPAYMKMFLMPFFNTISEISHRILLEKKLDVLPYLKQAWIDLCNAYLMEARWYYTGYTASLNEYLQNAWISISGHLILSTAYCSSKDLTVETLSNFKFYPNALRHSAMLFRLYDDLGTAKTEMQRGDVQKSIQCHMNEKKVSELEARHYFKNCLIRKYWKALNQEFLSNFGFVEAFKAALLGMPRMAQCMYQFGDGHSEPNLETKDRVIKLLIEPIPI